MIVESEKEALTMAKLAILASRPVGMGFLHFDPDLKFESIDLNSTPHGIYVDYYQGRMVKFNARRVGDTFEFQDGLNLSLEYQSWIGTYPSYTALHAAARSYLSKV